MLASCDYVFNNYALNEAASAFPKSGLIEVCGKQDKACIAAVKAQFDTCHKKYNKEWHAYMSASLFANDDKLLEAYTSSLYGCIVDTDGDPYFTSNTKK